MYSGRKAADTFGDGALEEVSALTILSFLVGPVIGGAGLYLAWKQLRRKQLAYEVHIYASLLSSSRLLEDHVQILFEGKPVENVSVAHLRIWNAGNEAIKRDDYEQPIIMRFGRAHVLSVEVLSTVPPNMKVNPKLVAGRIDFGRILMNPRDAIYLRVLLTGPKDPPTLETRIVGIRQPVRQDFVNEPRYLKFLDSCLQVTGLIFMLTWLSLLIVSTLHGPVQVGEVLSYVALLAAFTLLLNVCIVLFIRSRRYFLKRSRW